MKKNAPRPVPTAATSDEESPRGPSRERVLQAAEQLFASHGYAGTSLRAIMAQAQVDTGAIHYHFRNKLGLLRALFEQRVAPINDEREAQFDGIDDPAEPPELEAVLRAFIAPALRAAYSPEQAPFNRITALCSVDPEPQVRAVVFEAYDAAARRFARLLRAATPWLGDTDFQWRLECMYGSMMYIRSDNGRVSHLLDARHRRDQVEHVIDELVAFTAAGFRAPGTSCKKN